MPLFLGISSDKIAQKYFSFLEKEMLFFLGNSPASQGIFWSGGCIASCIYLPSSIPSMS